MDLCLKCALPAAHLINVGEEPQFIFGARSQTKVSRIILWDLSIRRRLKVENSFLPRGSFLPLLRNLAETWLNERVSFPFIGVKIMLRRIKGRKRGWWKGNYLILLLRGITWSFCHRHSIVYVNNLGRKVTIHWRSCGLGSIFMLCCVPLHCSLPYTLLLCRLPFSPARTSRTSNSLLIAEFYCGYHFLSQPPKEGNNMTFIFTHKLLDKFSWGDYVS